MIVEKNKDSIIIELNNPNDILTVFLYLNDSYNVKVIEDGVYEYKGHRFHIGDTLIVEKGAIQHAIRGN